MQLTQTVAPSSEPITKNELYTVLRISHSEEDTQLDLLIQTAREMAERFTNRQLMTATYRYDLMRFPAEFVLPRPPLGTISSLKYYDTDDTLQTFDSSKYQINGAEPARLTTVFGEVWPATRQQRYDAVQVTYTAGYASASAIPAAIRHGMMLAVAWLYEKYEKRDTVLMAGGIAMLPRSVKTHWAPYKVRWFQPGYES